MPHRSRWRPSRLVAGAGAVLAGLVLLTAGLSLAHERHTLLRQTAQRQALLARVLEDHATRSIDSALIALASLAETLARGAPPEVLQALLSQTQASLPALRGVALLDASGHVIAAADPADRAVDLDPQALGPWPAPGAAAVRGFVAARSLAGLQRAAVASPVPPGVGFIPMLRGVAVSGREGRRLLLVALLNPDALANFQQLTLNDEHSAAALIGLDGEVLAATGQAGQLGPLPGGRSAALSGADAPLGRVRAGREYGRWEGEGLRGEPQLGAFRALRARPLVVVVETPLAELRRQWLAEARITALLAAGSALALLVLSGIGAGALRSREQSRLALDRSRQRMADREQELSAIFGSVQDLLFRTDASGHVVFINERYAQLSGRPVSEALGQPLHALFGGAPEVATLFEPPPEVIDERPRHARADWVSPSGEARGFELTVVPLHRSDAELEWVGSATDVSALLRAQAELRAQLGLARSLLASSPLPMAVLDRDQRYLDVNRAWQQFTGHSRDAVLGRPAASVAGSGWADLQTRQDAELLAQGGEQRYETVWHACDGSRRDLFISKSTFPDAQGQPMGIVVTFMDISEFREAERATRAARDAALAASGAKSEFIANVSHELRTPLQSILGFSELGQLRGRQEPRLAEMFKDIHRAGERMLSLVNDLLDLSKIEQSQGPLAPERLDLRPLALEVLQELRPLLEARGLRVAVRLGGEPLVVMADAERLQQVLRNVLANAIKFSPVDGEILLRGEHDREGHVRLEVADRGPGIPPAELESIFEAFVQSSATKDGSGGTGLGLAICRRIMQAHRGVIHASNREGGGAVLHLRLPAARFGDTAPAAL